MLALVAFGGEVYILLQMRLYGQKITVAKSDGSTCSNETATLRSYLLWLALGVTVAAGLNFVLALVATARPTYWRRNNQKRTLWKRVLFPVIICFMGMTAGIMPVLLKKNDVSAMAAFIVLTLYFQTLVWALVLAWRDSK